MKKSHKPEFIYDPSKKELEAVPEATDKVAGSADEDFLFDLKNSEKKDMPKSHKTNDFSDLQKKPKPLWKKIMKWFGIIMLILGIIAAIAFTYIYLHASKISSNPFDLSSRLKGEGDGRVNILLLGIGDPGHAGETLSDTNMVVSIDTKSQPNKVTMISIPRDTRVYIPGHGYNKINEANALGGSQLAEQTVAQTLGIPIQYYITADFTGLKQAVDAVGGIDINVKDTLIDTEYPCENNEGKSCGLKILAGQQHMNGSTALKYARCRKGTCGDDFGRAARQQEVLQAIREKAISTQTLSNPSKVNNLINAASNNIKTDLSLKNIQRLIDITKGTGASDIINVVFSIKPNGFLVGDNSSSDLLPAGGNFDAIQKFIGNVFELAPIWKEDSNIIVLNGTTTVGLGGKFKNTLIGDGIPITIDSLGNAKTSTFTTSQIIDYTGGKNPNTANYLSKLLGVQVTQPTTPVKYPVTDFEVTLGSDYAAKISPKN
ncbi:MAG: LCP family protein [Candidatus Saccharibacteria bacterium]